MRPIEIRGLDHVVLRVRDLPRALAFYCDVLGCREERRLDALGLVQLRAGAHLIDLVAVDSPLGRALIGKEEGDEFLFRRPKGEVRYTIVAVRYPA